MGRRGRKKVKMRQTGQQKAAPLGSAESLGPGMNSSHTHAAFSKAEITVFFFLFPQRQVSSEASVLCVFLFGFGFLPCQLSRSFHICSAPTHAHCKTKGVLSGGR